MVLELGPRDLASGKIVLKRRDTGAKEPIPQTELAAKLAATLDECRTRNTTWPNSASKTIPCWRTDRGSGGDSGEVTAEKGGGKFVMAHVKDDPVCDARMKEFKATVRCIPLVDEYDGPGKCIVTGETVDRRVVIAKAY